MTRFEHRSDCFGDGKLFTKPVVLPGTTPEEPPVGYIVEWCGKCGAAELGQQFYP